MTLRSCDVLGLGRILDINQVATVGVVGATPERSVSPARLVHHGDVAMMTYGGRRTRGNCRGLVSMAVTIAGLARRRGLTRGSRSGSRRRDRSA